MMNRFKSQSLVPTHVQGSELFSSGRVDTDQVVKVLFPGFQLDHSSEALRHFPSVGAEVMESQNSHVVSLVADQLCIRGILRPLGHGPFQRPKVGVENFNVLKK